MFYALVKNGIMVYCSFAWKNKLWTERDIVYMVVPFGIRMCAQLAMHGCMHCGGCRACTSLIHHLNPALP
jgi:hypothetical protein